MGCAKAVKWVHITITPATKFSWMEANLEGAEQTEGLTKALKNLFFADNSQKLLGNYHMGYGPRCLGAGPCEYQMLWD